MLPHRKQGSSRPATSVFCEIKIQFLSVESGGVEESDMKAVSG